MGNSFDLILRLLMLFTVSRKLGFLELEKLIDSQMVIFNNSLENKLIYELLTELIKTDEYKQENLDLIKEKYLNISDLEKEQKNRFEAIFIGFTDLPYQNDYKKYVLTLTEVLGEENPKVILETIEKHNIPERMEEFVKLHMYNDFKKFSFGDFKKFITENSEG